MVMPLALIFMTVFSFTRRVAVSWIESAR
jgi:hypothetical protein